MNPLSFVFAYVVFPGLFFAAAVGLFFEGIDRKIGAHFQNRIGPPVWQPYLDIGKLMSKEDITPAASQRWVFTLAPLLALGAIVTVMVMLPINSAQPAFSSAGDVIVIIYLLNIPAIAMMLGGYASASPFGIAGSGRYMVQLFAYELAFIIAVLTVAAQAGTLSLAGIMNYQAQNGWLLFQLPLAGAAALLVVPGKLLRTPFDIPEAETEIVCGPLTEYSGPKLAIFRLAYNIETFAVAGFIAALFLGGPVAHTIAGVQIPGIVSFFIKCLAIVVLITLIRCATARVRIDQALKFYWMVVAVLALINMAVVVL
jgi:NADH-quinone oxidoreductase subunit H